MDRIFPFYLFNCSPSRFAIMAAPQASPHTFTAVRSMSNILSTAKIIPMPSSGRFTAFSTITIVTSPAPALGATYPRKNANSRDEGTPLSRPPRQFRGRRKRREKALLAWLFCSLYLSIRRSNSGSSFPGVFFAVFGPMLSFVWRIKT